MNQAINEHTPPQPPLTSGKTAVALSATIDRLKQIAGEAMDHLILSDAPPQPDYELLDVCGDLLHMMKRRKGLYAQHHALFREDNFDRQPEEEQDRRRAQSKRLTAEADSLDGPISSLLSRARRLPATTAAGVYAKVLVIRASQTGAGRLAQTLADDLINVPSLRASIWPNEGDQAHG